MIIVSPTELYDFLKSKGVEHLYFSSTVKNACSMIRSKTLMSLRVLSLNKLPMSSVNNEATYKQCCMWNKIPLYLYNLHGYFTRQNKNGPVCFKLSIDFLTEINKRDLHISKRNPLNWKSTLTKNDICYSSVDELSQRFDTLYDERKIHKTIILVRDKKSRIDLSKYLCEISLDYLNDKHLLFKRSKKALNEAICESGLNNIPLKTLKCENFCFCQANYSEMPKEELENLFLPK